MKAEQVMSRDVQCVSPDTSVLEAAGLMRKLNVGSLPVCEKDRLSGMITDRDIVVRAVADGKDPGSVKVRDAMSEGIVYGYADQDIDEITQVMEKRQIRRLPLLNREKRLVGIIATADIALETDPETTGEVMHDISLPTPRQGH